VGLPVEQGTACPTRVGVALDGDDILRAHHTVEIIIQSLIDPAAIHDKHLAHAL
jgi:hypothetical protein